MRKTKIAVDFDGTLCVHAYPHIGSEVPFAFYILKKLQEAGHQLILFTMRSGKELDEAVQWCEDRGIRFYGVNKDPDQEIWTKSPKAYAEVYIDDAALGCPLIGGRAMEKFGFNEIDHRPFVDWRTVSSYLTKMGHLSL